MCFRATSFTESFPASCHHDHLLSSLFSFVLLDHSQRYSDLDADQSAGEKSSYCCSLSYDMSPYGDTVHPSFSS